MGWDHVQDYLSCTQAPHKAFQQGCDLGPSLYRPPSDERASCCPGAQGVGLRTEVLRLPQLSDGGTHARESAHDPCKYGDPTMDPAAPVSACHSDYSAQGRCPVTEDGRAGCPGVRLETARRADWQGASTRLYSEDKLSHTPAWPGAVTSAQSEPIDVGGGRPVVGREYSDRG